MPNVLSVDVEDYYHGVLHVSVEDGARYTPRLGVVLPRLLDWLDEVGARATLFVLGAVAEAWPAIIRDAARRGHEVAAHGYTHTHLARTTPTDFRRDLQRVRAVLEDATGQAVIGFRAPYFSITRKTLWALPILGEAGFRYDSSIFPTWNPLYGIYSAPLSPWEIEGLGLCEFPPSTLSVGGLRLPVAGGGYLRLLPGALLTRALRRIARRRGHTVVYMHPWEFDGQQPRVHRNPLEYVLYGYGLRRFVPKMTTLVRTLSFTSFRDAYFADGPPAFARLPLSRL